MEKPTAGYDFEVISDTGKDFECPICMLLLREPIELPCAHVFCKVCLEHWQVNPMEKDAAFLCPSCKKVYQREQVAGNKFLNRYVKTSLQVKCKENKVGCQWEGKIIDYTEHEKKCVYKTINCIFIGCREAMLVMDLAKHQSECTYRSVQCEHCLLEVQLIKLMSHYYNCAEIPVICPNDGCSLMTPRKEVCNHTQNECPYQMVNCKYHAVGCQRQFRRRYTTLHQTEGLHDHMNMLLDGFNMTSQELSSVKEKLQQSHETLLNTEERLQTTEEKCLKTEEKLQQTEESLAMTNQNLQKTKAIVNQTQKELQNANRKLLEANEKIINIKNHNQKIAQVCFQLTSINCVIVGLKSLATMDNNEIPEFNINSPEMWIDLHKMLEAKKNVPKDYADRFIDVMNIMETKKLYKVSEKEVFLKVDVINKELIYVSFKDYGTQHSVVFWNNRRFQSCMYIEFRLPGWNENNVKIFLLDPTKSTPAFLHNCDYNEINKNLLVQKNTVLVKAVLQ